MALRGLRRALGLMVVAGHLAWPGAALAQPPPEAGGAQAELSASEAEHLGMTQARRDPPNPWLASLLVSYLGPYPMGAMLGYNYAGDPARGWQVLGWQAEGAGLGAILGLAVAPYMGPSPAIGRNPFDPIPWVVTPLLGAWIGHAVVAGWAAVDVHGVASRWGQTAPGGPLPAPQPPPTPLP